MSAVKVAQHGEKSVYVEQNTGQITIHSNGEVRVINPSNREEMDLLRQEMGEGFREILEAIKRFAPASEIPQLLTPPPFLSEVFMGREQDLQTIHDRLFEPQGHLLLLVNGEGGIGKTSLASQYFHRFGHEYRHIAWVLRERSIADALLQLATPLGLQFEERASTDERLETLLKALAQLQRPCLLVVDNANELADLEQNLPRLQRCSNFHILLTTRVSECGAARFFKIEPLPEDLALEVFRTHYRAFEQAEEPVFREIYRAVGGNTLVLELFAKNLNHFNNRLKKRYLLSQLRADIEQGLLRLSQSAEVPLRYQAPNGLRRATPEAVVAVMYDLSELLDAERALLANFAVLPAERIPFEHLESLLDAADLDTLLLALAQKGWLDFAEEDKTFKCSSVVQEVCRMKNPRLAEDCAGLVDSLCEKLRYEGSSGHLLNVSYEAAAHFAKYGGAVVLGLAQMPSRGLSVLSERVGRYFQTIGFVEQVLLYFQKGIDIDQKLLAAEPDNPNFKNGLAISYAKLGETHTALGNLPKALTFFEEYNRLKKELHEDYPQNVDFKKGSAISYGKLGETHTALGNLPKALTFFEKDLELSKELHEAYPQNVSFKNGLAISYEKLGSTHTKLGNLPKALTFFEERNRLAKELHEAYPQNVEFKNSLAISYVKLASVYLETDLEKAKKNLREAEKHFSELVAISPDNVQFQQYLGIVRSVLSELE